jgi:peptidoglycan/LPS O-acetylase OafA/YrhL
MRDTRLTGHVLPLDGVRGVAILSVMGFHVAQGLQLPGPLALVAGFGWAGVDLFFALSGFLITGILLDARGRPDYYRRFYARRTRRIFPLYFAYIGVLAVLMPGDWFPWYATYLLNVRVALANNWSASVAGTAFFWSLCVEEQFYAVWPAIVARLTDRRVLRLCLALAALALVARIWAVATGHVFAAYVLLFTRMDGLALGAAAAVVARQSGGLDRLARWAPWALGSAGVVLAFLVARTHYAGWDTPAMASVGYSLTATASVSLLVLAVAHRPRVFTLAGLRYAGRRCYGLYVLGGVAGAAAHALALPASLSAVVSVALAFLMAEASWRVIERPMIQGWTPRLVPAHAKSVHQKGVQVIPAEIDGPV